MKYHLQNESSDIFFHRFLEIYKNSQLYKHFYDKLQLKFLTIEKSFTHFKLFVT